MDEAAGSLILTADATAKPQRRRRKEPESMAISIQRHRLERGTIHREVPIAQALLAAHGFPVDDPEEGVGEQTVEAIKAFQKSKGIKADGVIGLLTWKALELAE